MKTNYFYRNFIHRTHLDQFWPHVLMLVGCALVTLLFVISYTHSTLNDQTVHMAKTNKEKIQRLDEMLILMLDAETSIRGFLVTHSEPYLVPFNNSLERYPKLITLMNKDFPEGSEDRAQFIHLKELIQQKFTHMVLALNKEGLVSPIPVGSSGRGKELMDDIRVTISVLKIKRTTANEVLEREAMARLGIIQSVIYLLAFGALFLILSLFYVQQRQSALRARIHQLLENRNTRLEALVEQRTFALTDLASHLTNAREEERQHLARELHDELGALLTVAKMDASGLLRTLGASAEQAIKDRFRRLIDSIGSAISLKRRIIDDLRPPLLQGLGLIEALRALTGC